MMSIVNMQPNAAQIYYIEEIFNSRTTAQTSRSLGGSDDIEEIFNSRTVSHLLSSYVIYACWDSHQCLKLYSSYF